MGAIPTLAAVLWLVQMPVARPLAGPAQRLTSSGARNGQAAFSPDGGRLAFVSDREGGWQVFVSGADGSRPRSLTNEHGPVGGPAWSVGGDWIHYYARRDGRYVLLRVPADGGAAGIVWADEYDAFRPSPSPDGSLLLFDRYGATDPPNHELYVLDATGGLRRLTDDPGYDSDARWSPDGTRIAFHSGRASEGSDPYERMEIFLMGADGGDVRQLTGDGDNRYPAWSPDGERIAYVSGRTGNRDIWIVRIDGTEHTRLTRHPGKDEGPAWSPDGRRIVFTSDRFEGAEELCVMELRAHGAVE